MDSLVGTARKWVGRRANSWEWGANGARMCGGCANGWKGAQTGHKWVGIMQTGGDDANRWGQCTNSWAERPTRWQGTQMVAGAGVTRAYQELYPYPQRVYPRV